MPTTLDPSRLARLATAGGYASWEQAINRTAVLSAKEAAQQLSVPVSFVTAERRRLHVTPPTTLQQAHEVLKRLRALGWRDTHEIARAAGLSASTIEQVESQRRVNGRVPSVRATTVARLTALLTQRPGTPPRREVVIPSSRGADPSAARRQLAAEAAGFDSWEAAIRATVGMPAVEAAARLHFSETTISEWRRRLQLTSAPVVSRTRYVLVTLDGDRPAFHGEHDSLPDLQRAARVLAAQRASHRV